MGDTGLLYEDDTLTLVARQFGGLELHIRTLLNTSYESLSQILDSMSTVSGHLENISAYRSSKLDHIWLWRSPPSQDTQLDLIAQGDYEELPEILFEEYQSIVEYTNNDIDINYAHAVLPKLREATHELPALDLPVAANPHSPRTHLRHLKLDHHT